MVRCIKVMVSRFVPNKPNRHRVSYIELTVTWRSMEWQMTFLTLSFSGKWSSNWKNSELTGYVQNGYAKFSSSSDYWNIWRLGRYLLLTSWTVFNGDRLWSRCWAVIRPSWITATWAANLRIVKLTEDMLKVPFYRKLQKGKIKNKRP